MDTLDTPLDPPLSPAPTYMLTSLCHLVADNKIILGAKMITVGWKGQPLSLLQPCSLLGLHNHKLQATLTNERGSPSLHDRYVSPPCALIKYRRPRHSTVKCSNTYTSTVLI